MTTELHPLEAHRLALAEWQEECDRIRAQHALDVEAAAADAGRWDDRSRELEDAIDTARTVVHQHQHEYRRLDRRSHELKRAWRDREAAGYIDGYHEERKKHEDELRVLHLERAAVEERADEARAVLAGFRGELRDLGPRPRGPAPFTLPPRPKGPVQAPPRGPTDNDTRATEAEAKAAHRAVIVATLGALASDADRLAVQVVADLVQRLRQAGWTIEPPQPTGDNDE